MGNEVYYNRIIELIMRNITKSSSVTDIQSCQFNTKELDSRTILDESYLDWIVLLDNLIGNKSVVRDLFFKLYFKNSHEDDDKDSDLVVVGKAFLTLLFKSMFQIQNILKMETFNRCTLVVGEYYFFISYFIKNLVENNYMPFKRLIGELKFSKDDEPNNELLQKYYEGLIENLDGNSDGFYTPGSRADLILPNIVTISTLTEFFNGPCKENQKAYNNFNKDDMFNALKQIHMNILSPMYKYQEAICLFFSSLFEGNHKEQLKSLSKLENGEPEEFFKLIITHLESLYDNRDTVDRLRTTKDEEPETIANELSIKKKKSCWSGGKKKKKSQIDPLISVFDIGGV